MSTSNTNPNPFILPGLGQDGNLSGNPLLASMEMMSKAWSGLAGPGGLAQSLPITPPMNLEDLDRRIAELRSVENWLRMNLSMLSGTIQGMEVQRSTIATLRSFVAGASGSGDGPSSLEIMLGLKPAPASAPAPAAASYAPSSSGDRSSSSAEKPSASTSEPGVTGADAAHMADQVNQASQAWWGLLQQQFNQIATATASSMPDTAPMQTAAQPVAAASTTSAAPPVESAPRTRAPRKTAPKRAATPRKS